MQRTIQALCMVRAPEEWGVCTGDDRALQHPNST